MGDATSGMTSDGPPAGETRFGFIAIIGAPNAGKSTLVNTLVGAKVSIVSHKVQTTRMPVRGIAIEGASQLVFIDTPGIFAPRRRLDRAMVDAAWGGAGDADVVAMLIDAAKGLDEEVERILDRLKDTRIPLVLVLNKVDRVKKERLLDLLASEITREKIFERLHDELPYEITVETTSWLEQKKGVRVEQTIFVERDSQKAIVLGNGGRTIRQLSMDSRKELAEIVEKPVHLFLFVKVRENWGNDPERYRELGLTFPKD